MSPANLCKILNTILLMLTFLCLNEIKETRSQLTEEFQENFINTRNEISCTVVNSKNDDGLDLFNYDCSNKELDWPHLEKLIDHIRGSSNLNLASNRFDPLYHTIYNKSFSLFQILENTLNLSSNNFQHVESHAFYYSPSNEEKPPPLAPLSFKHLDLSNNAFDIIPWKSVEYLPALETLYLSSNNLKSLDFGDTDTKIKINNNDKKLFPVLTKLYLNKCKIENIDPMVFKLFKALQFIDLADNNIKHLSSKISMLTPQPLNYMNLIGNPLECDCELLWFKNFMLKNEYYFKKYDYPQKKEQYCFINITKQNENNPLLVGEEFIDLMPEADYSKNLYQRKPLSAKRSEPNDVVTETKAVSIAKLSNDQFLCELDLSGNIRNYSSNIIELKCRVTSHPKAIIRWMFGQRVLDRLYLVDNKKFKIDEQFLVNHINPYSTIVESKLIIAYTGSLTKVGREEYSCRTSHLLSHQKAMINGKYFKAEPVYDQKMVLFIINSKMLPKDQLSQNETVLNALASSQIIPDDIRDVSSSNNLFRQYIIWIMIVSCCIFVCMVITFAVFCVIRTKRNAKLEEQMYTGGTNINYSYNSIYKRSSTYLPNNSIKGDINSAIIPLKPDVRREHQESNSIYANINRTPSRSSYGMYETPEHKSKPGALLRNSKNSTYSDYYYNNTVSSYKFPTNSFSQDDTDQSYDKNPVESSLILDDSSTTSSKSFEENIEEYKEPKFVDLRKPANSKSKSQLFDQNQQNI